MLRFRDLTPAEIAARDGVKPETKIQKPETNKRLSRPAKAPPPKRTRGRPKSTSVPPWETAGMSRAAWYRSKKATPA